MLMAYEFSVDSCLVICNFGLIKKHMLVHLVSVGSYANSGQQQEISPCSAALK